MKIEFTGRQTEVPPEIRRLAERRLQKLTRILPGITRAHVTVSTDKHRHIAEVSIRSKHLDLAAQEESSDFGLSLSTVMDKLTRQVQRHLGRRRERKRDGRSRAKVRPLTLDEAAREAGNRRRDGRPGLIEPEA